jgi:GH25 family lysozyme M1 (1,4-beta-N-acetylmuramidase)
MSDPLNVVVDISHHNGNVNLAKAKEDGILGVIQKATQGQSFKDPTYYRNRQKAKDAGLLWGAYHFATGSDGLKQAQHFLDVVGNDPKTLLVLDFEPNPTGPSMDLEEARAFVTHINEERTRFPGFYSGHYIKHSGLGEVLVLARAIWSYPSDSKELEDLDDVAVYRRRSWAQAAHG